MTYYHDSFLIPDFENEKFAELAPIAEFISDRLSKEHLSLRTADDPRERDEHLASMLLCGASLTLLNIAYLSESTDIVNTVKTLMRHST